MKLRTESDMEQLVRSFQESLLRYCIGILGSREDAEDAVQSAFIKAWKKRGSLKNEEALKSWLYRIAYSTAVDHLRARKETTELPEHLPGGAYKEQDTGLSEEVAAALLQLSVLDRAIVEERILEEMSYEEMSEVHRMSEAALRKRYSRAREKLRTLLRENHSELTNDSVG